MPSIHSDQSSTRPGAGVLGGVTAMAIKNMTCSDDIARASRHVITKRVALGIEAALLPHRADHGEFARMVPEKVEAFSAAGKAILQKSGEANRKIIQQASMEVMTAASAALSMSRCANPADLAAAQGRFASGWMHRATSRFMAMGVFAMNTQAAAMAPIRQTVVDNSARLAG